MLEAQNAVLRLVAGGAPLLDVLDASVGPIERHVAPGRCSIMLLAPDGKGLRHACGPRLAAGLGDTLDAGDRDAAPWVAAMLRRKPAAADLTSGAVAPELQERARAAGFRDCLAQPILSHTGSVLGAITLFHPGPGPADGKAGETVLDLFTPLIATAIELDQRAHALRSADERFASLAASVPGVVYQRLVTPDGDIRYTYISDGVRDLFGVTPAEVLADPNALFARHDPVYAATFRERLLAASRALQMWDVEAAIISRDGQQKFTHAIARPCRQPDGSVLWNGLVLDATRIKRAEMAAAAAEASTRQAIVECLSQGLVMFGSDDRLMICNSSFLQLYPGLAEVAVTGAAYEDVIRAEFGHVGTSGDPSIEEQLKRRLEQHALRHHAFERQLPDKRWVLVSERRTPDGGTVVLHTDITKLREREDERSQLQEQFYRAQKMEAMGRLAGGIAHDFNNILAAILGNAAFLVEDLPPDSDLSDFARQIVVAGERAKHLVQQILAFSRKQSSEYETLDVAAIVDEAVQLLRAALPASIELNVRMPIHDAVVQGNATQLVQVLMNLCVNARDAIGSGHGTIDLEVRLVAGEDLSASELPRGIPAGRAVSDPDGAIHVSTGSLMPGAGYVAIRVRDSGCGMDAGTVERMFEPFFTTKVVGKGTGLGLAAVHGIVAAHGGVVATKTKQGHGSTFEVFLPTVAASRSCPTGTVAADKPRGSEAILVVDDETGVSAMLARMLQRLGYKVDCFTSAGEALAAFRTSPDAWALAITDQTMPQMTGYELAREILRQIPDFPVVLCSGFADMLSAEAAAEAGIRAFLTKPVDHDVLARTVRDLLQRRAA